MSGREADNNYREEAPVDRVDTIMIVIGSATVVLQIIQIWQNRKRE